MISWDRVHELRREIGDDDFQEVVELFLDEVEEVLARLTTPGATVDHVADLHFLKGSALNLGFHEFGDVCRAGEVSAAGRCLRTEEIERVADVYAVSKRQFLDSNLRQA